MADDPPIGVAIWSDFVCPFCNVARERADWLRREAGAQIEWLPFELHPEYPPEGLPRQELTRRYGDNFQEQVRRMNEEAGLTYNPLTQRYRLDPRDVSVNYMLHARKPG